MQLLVVSCEVVSKIITHLNYCLGCKKTVSGGRLIQFGAIALLLEVLDAGHKHEMSKW